MHSYNQNLKFLFVSSKHDVLEPIMLKKHEEENKRVD
jgi:hypothetical protein